MLASMTWFCVLSGIVVKSSTVVGPASQADADPDRVPDAALAGGEAWRRMRDLTHHPVVLQRTSDLAEEIGLTPAITKALVHLSQDRPVPMRELAGALRCDNSYVTAVVDGLEERGVAHRQPHPTDRRIKVVVLTDTGATLAARVRAVLDEPPASFARLTDDEARQLRDLLRKLSDPR
jgi:DNA-binding MarR family transcriptional regulator